MGVGTSPFSTIRSRFCVGSGTGIADSNALVYGCSGSCIQARPTRDLDDLAEIHHSDAVRNMFDDREPVRNKQIRQPKFVLQVLQQVDDLRLNRNVERRNRLVADDQFRIQRKRPGDADSLPLTARKFVRISSACISDRVRPLPIDRQRGRFCSALVPDAVDLQRLGDDRKNAHTRIEAGVWVLKYDLHLAAAAACISRLRIPTMFSPFEYTSPLVGSSSRKIQRPTVDLPQPDSPTSPSVSPAIY